MSNYLSVCVRLSRTQESWPDVKQHVPPQKCPCVCTGEYANFLVTYGLLVYSYFIGAWNKCFHFE